MRVVVVRLSSKPDWKMVKAMVSNVASWVNEWLVSGQPSCAVELRCGQSRIVPMEVRVNQVTRRGLTFE